MSDAWTDAEAYERYVGRWGRLVAREFVGWLGLAPGGSWLDVGCGTGVVTATILELAQPAAVLGVDPSEAFVARARASIAAPPVTFAVGDGARLPVPDAAFDAVVAGLVLNFMPDAHAALTEWRRVVGSGGVIGAYVWDYGEGMQLIRRFWDAAIAGDPAARALDEATRFPITRPGALEAAFEAAGLIQIDARAFQVATHFTGFDDLWQPFLGGVGPGPAYLMSLGAAARGALRDRLRASLPVAADGSIDLVARAWAARGSRPARSA